MSGSSPTSPSDAAGVPALGASLAGSIGGAEAPTDTAPLPTELADLVIATVRRTRLRRPERRAVEAELTAHFIDGLASGESHASLRDRFGEPRVVARMVRSTVRAKRSPIDRACGLVLRGMLLAPVVLLLVYGALAARLWFSSPTIASDPVERIARLTPDVGAHETAWPHYREVLRRLRDAGIMPATDDAAGAIDPRRRDEAAWSTAAAALRDHRADIDALRAAALMPRLGYRIDWSVDPEDLALSGLAAEPVQPAPDESRRSAFSISLPQIAALRRAARCLATDATVAAADGDGRRAADDLAAILGIVEHVEEGPFFISQLVGSANVSLMAQQTIALLEVFPDAFDEPALETIDAAIARAPERLRRLDTTFEQLGFEDVVQRVYTDDGRGGGRFLPTEWARLKQSWTVGSGKAEATVADALLAPATSVMVADRAELLSHYREYMNELAAAGERPLWEFSFDSSRWLDHHPDRLGDPYVVFSMLAPAIDGAIAIRQIAWYRLQAVRAAVGLKRFRLAEGRWPDSLNELVPRFMPSVPVDPFDGKPLRYRLESGSPILWSIGHDRDDDGGVVDPRPDAPDSPAIDDRDASATWKHADVAKAAVKERDAPPGAGLRHHSIRFGDWIIFAPGWSWESGIRN